MGKKVCTSCGIEKDLNSGFYAHAGMLDGHLNKCKECVKSRVKNHRANNDSTRKYDRWRYYNVPERAEHAKNQRKKWAEDNPERYYEGKKQWIKNNPLKRKAHVAVGNAIRSGKLIKEPCVICGSEKVDAHHDDYDKPLEVIWLCRTHHQERHRKYEVPKTTKTHLRSTKPSANT